MSIARHAFHFIYILQRFAGDKLYEMEDMHMGFGLLDLTILIS